MKEGIDVPVCVSYFVKEKNTYVFDDPVLYSELKEKYKTRDEMSKALCERCNELGKMELLNSNTLKVETENT